MLARSEAQAVRSPRNTAPRRAGAARIEPPTLGQFLLLSMLLHLWIIVLFGNAPGTGVRRGEGEGAWWGPLDVTLRQFLPETTRESRGAEERPRALTPRPPALAPQPKPEPAPASRQPPSEAPTTAEPTPLTAPASIEKLSSPEIEREIAPPVTLPPREVPVVPSAPIERIAPREIERAVAPPVELPPREVPLVPSAPIERIAPREIEPSVAPPVELPPREAPLLPSAPIERIAPREIERNIAPPVELPPREVPVVPAAPIERIAPRGLERELAPAVPEISRPAAVPTAPAPSREAAPPGEAAPAQRTAPPTGTPSAERPSGTSVAPAQSPARPEARPLEDQTRLRFGTPPAPPEEEIFRQRRDVVTPATEPGGAPHIDRDASRERAREIASGRSGSRGVFNLPLPVPPEKKSKEAVAIEKAQRPDCREAYQGLGLLAAPVLLANAITDTGCKW